jgi:hypothetical protein
MKRFVISSKTKTSGTNSNFKTRLNKPIGEVNNLFIESITMSHGWYSIMAGINDAIDFKVATTTYNITITEGVYGTPNDLAAEITTRANALYVPDNDFLCSYSSTTKKFTFAHASTSFVLEWTDLADSAAETLGWIETDTSSATSHEADYVPNLSYTNHIVIASPQLGGTDFRSPQVETDTVFMLPVTGTFGDYITYENQGSHFRIRLEGEELKEIEIQVLFDDFETLVPLNGTHITIVFSYD